MKATIQSTTEIVETRDPQGRPALARVWEGITEAGVPFTAYITTVQVRTDADNTVFVRELQEHVAPSAETIRAIDLRFVL